MRIKESSMELESSGFKQSVKVEATSFTGIVQDNQSDGENEKNRIQQMDALELSFEGSQQSFSGYHFLSTEEIQKAEDLKALDEEFISEEDKLKIQLIEAFMSRLLKREYKINLFTLHTKSDEDKNVEDKLRKLEQHNKKRAIIENRGSGKEDRKDHPKKGARIAGPIRRASFKYEHYQEEFKSQQLDFSAKGKIVLEDGKEIEVDYELHLSEHSHTQFSEILQGESILIDPIVINYDGAVTDLTKEKYSFDIDLDGKEDQISFATKGAGFLALDKNDNGLIDDGSELFGPSTNDGFAELSVYDDDNNGWIDENDAVFNQLRIWERDEDGSSKLMSLGEVGIGALYLKDVTTLFDISDDTLDLQGKMKNSSIYLNEDGTAGSIHEIDLVI